MRKILLYLWLILEVIISYKIGFDANRIKIAGLVFLGSSALIGLILLILLNVVPVISMNFGKIERSFGEWFKYWKECLFIIALNFPLCWAFFSAAGFTKVIPVLLFIINIFLLVFIIFWIRLRGNMNFAYNVAAIARKDPKKAAEYLAKNPGMIDMLMNLVPGGVIGQLALGQLKNKIEKLRDEQGRLSEQAIEELLPDIEQLGQLKPQGKSST